MTKLADECARRAFLFFWNESHPKTGLTKDRAKTPRQFRRVQRGVDRRHGLRAGGAGDRGGARLEIEESEARARVLLTLRFVHDKLKNVRGFHYHFVDWKTGARV